MGGGVIGIKGLNWDKKEDGGGGRLAKTKTPCRNPLTSVTGCSTVDEPHSKHSIPRLRNIKESQKKCCRRWQTGRRLLETAWLVYTSMHGSCGHLHKTKPDAIPARMWEGPQGPSPEEKLVVVGAGRAMFF